MRRGKVLLLGCGNRTFLAAVRSLGRAGLEVHAVSDRAGRPEFKSRYLSRLHDLPDLDSLLEMMARERFQLVLPLSEESILQLWEHRHEFPAVHFLNAPAFEVTRDKFMTSQLARQLGIPQSDPQLVDLSSDLSAFVFPLFAKPLQSCILGQPDRHQVSRVHHLAELQGLVQKEGRLLLERPFPGHGVGLEVLALQGEVVVSFQHKRIRERPGWGSTYRLSEAVDPRLEDAARRFMGATHYTGVGMLEFRRNRQGEFVLLEVNGRFWGSLPLAVAAGVDFPLYLYQAVVEGRRDFPRHYPVGLAARNLFGDLVWLQNNWDVRRVLPHMTTVLGEAARFLRGRESWDSWAWDDPWPALHEIFSKLAGRG